MRTTYKILYRTLAPLLKVLFRVHGHGQENEPETGTSFVVCANHISELDPICINIVLGKTEPYYMAKAELFKIPLLRGLLKNIFHAFPVKRGGSDLAAIRKTGEILSEGGCIGIFPQGTRCRGVEIEETEFKTGASLIVAKNQADVLPVRIVIKKNRWRLFRRIDIYVGEMIRFEEFDYDKSNRDSYEKMAQIIKERICQLGN